MMPVLVMYTALESVRDATFSAWLSDVPMSWLEPRVDDQQLEARTLILYPQLARHLEVS